MKSLLYAGAVLSCSAMFVFTACKKKGNPEKESPVETPDGQSGIDNREVQGENDVIINEINDVIRDSRLAGKNASASEVSGVTGDFCGLTVDSIDIANGSITFSYTGVTCLNRTRTGVIKLTLQQGSKWANAGSAIKIEYVNYKVVRASDQKSVLLNGTQYLTNVSGGTWWDLIVTKTKPALISTITSTDLNVTFEDNKTATYNINRQITYTYPNTAGTNNYILTVTAEGTGSNSGLNNLENYGTTRNGEPFTSQVISPIVWNLTCGGAVLQGDVNIKVASKALDLRFLYGVDVNGNSMQVSPNQCPYGWKLEWTNNGTTNFKVFGYN